VRLAVTDLSDALKSYLQAAESVRKAEAECAYDRSYFLDSDYRHLEATEKRFVAELAKRVDQHKVESATVCGHCKQNDCEEKDSGWCLDNPE